MIVIVPFLALLAYECVYVFFGMPFGVFVDMQHLCAWLGSVLHIQPVNRGMSSLVGPDVLVLTVSGEVDKRL